MAGRRLLSGLGIAAGLAWPVAAAPDAPRPAWSIEGAWLGGYVAGIRHACPQWDMVPERMPHEVSFAPSGYRAMWGPGSPVPPAFRRGGLTAQADAERDLAFCLHPTRLRAPQHPRLPGLIRPKPPDPPPAR